MKKTSQNKQLMRIFDIYLFKNLFAATVFIAVTLAFIVFLTQSLKFLEIVINAGSSGGVFWKITLLALPRFFEVILPLAVMAATLFLYNKMNVDSELVAMRAIGHSHIALAKPALMMGAIVCVLLWFITMWLAPTSVSKMQKMRLELSSEFSTGLFREGIFNQLGKGITLYIRDRKKDGELTGIMIHDTRDPAKPPSTVLAKSGMIVASETAPQVVVFNGARHEYNPQTGVLQRLAFDRYTIDLPESDAVPHRWQQPDERTISELMRPDMENKRDVENLREFNAEIHRRITSPLMALAFPLIALNMLLLGGTDRRGQVSKIIFAVLITAGLQLLFMAASNLAGEKFIGIVLLYALTVLPCAAALTMLTATGEKLRLEWRLRRRGFA